MKLATLRDGSRDGALLLVSRDGQQAVSATDIAPHLQAALDRWDDLHPRLQTRYDALQAGICNEAFPLDVHQLAAPLPRAYQWLDGSAFLHHVELVRKARGATMPPSFYKDPLMYQGGSDRFLAPTEDIVHKSVDWGIDFEAEIAVITGDVPYQTTAAQAAPHVRLLMLVNDVSLRHLIPDELAKGFGFVVSKPPSACSPFAITPDELGDAWQDGRVWLPLEVHHNDTLFGRPHAGGEMHFSFYDLLAHVCQTRPLCAGTIIGSGTISNQDPSVGSCCIAERRMLEKIESGESKTPFMQFGDTVTIEMKKDGISLFGRIHQRVVPWQGK